MSKFNIGDKVKYIGEDHREIPEIYPEIGNIGTVTKEGGDTDWYIQWPKGSTSGKDCGYCDENDIVLVKDVDMPNEEIWKMLKPKMEKNGGHWEPVDPENLPKEGTMVRYSRENIDYKNEPEFIKLGEIGKFKLGKYTELPGIEFDDGRFWDWVCFSNEIDCLDMWVEDDE